MTTATRAIEALLHIIADGDVWIGKRIEATEGLLAYEAPPNVVEFATKFLTEVFEDESNDVELRLGALKLVRKAEAKRVTQATASRANEYERRQMGLRRARANRRVMLVRAGLWPGPKGWADDLQGEKTDAEN